jgi:ATP-binding cassette subfamily B protein
MVLTPMYDFASNVAQILLLAYGIYLIAQGNLAIGFFISFLAYVNRFYDPLRQMAAIWSTFQTALAGWSRISQLLALESDLPMLALNSQQDSSVLLSFSNVSFTYEEGVTVLRNTDLALERGKTYALVGPTGGGKTTTASLMARLYDPSEGTVFFGGRDMRAYSPQERTEKIGFILQDPFLFSGTIRENILYGNRKYENSSAEELMELIVAHGLETLLDRFPEGLDTKISSNADGMSIGQRQLIAFIRALLRDPELLILDEATANIDTVTEALLEDILSKLPKETTKVIIAHRLNTIQNADQIFFVNGGAITPAGSFDQAVKMLLEGKRTS